MIVVSMGTQKAAKKRMLSDDLQGRGIVQPMVLLAFQNVPREDFIPDYLKESAYDDRALPIGFGATISQPYVVARTLQEAQIPVHGRVLEIGTGSGYQTALLAEMGFDVYSIEIIPELSHQAAKALKNLNYHNVHLKIGDGRKGWPEKIEFDSILLTAVPQSIPESLVAQLKIGGTLVGPEGSGRKQWLIKMTRTETSFEKVNLLPVQFVPLI